MNIIKKLTSSKHFKDWIVILTLFALVTFSLDINASTLQTNLYGSKQHSPFDGTVMPIQNVPDWTHSNSTENDLTYTAFPSSKLVSTPVYRNDYLTFPSTDLVWGNATHDLIRNTLITYSVPYAGSYSFESLGENAGSHPGIDIKALKGTPVYAIANGIVTKTSFQSSGFGNHLVIGHNDVPKPGSRSQTTDLYSSYSHLSKIFVSEGEVVRKGQVIGEVGDSGTSTTDHLHFQLDNELSPWQPYWPFTSAEVSSAGLSFWEAVSAGFNQDNVYRYTYNAMDWVQENLDGSPVDKVTPVDPVPEPDPEPLETVDPEPITPEDPVEEVVEEETISAVVKVGFEDLNLETPDFVLVGNYEDLTINLLDSSGYKVDADFDGQINVTVSDSNYASLNRNFLTVDDFKNGSAELRLYAEREGQVTIIVEIAGSRYESNLISSIVKVQPFARFGIEVDGRYAPGVEESVIIRALDAEGNPTPSFTAGGKIELNTVMGSGTFSKDVLTDSDFINGVAEVFFIGDDLDDVVIQTLYGKAKAESKLMKAKLFSDLSSAHENYTAVSYLFKKGTVQGYPDGTFKPAQTVSRVEALKFIFSGMDQETQDNLLMNFTDAYSTEWYAPFVATAQNLGIVQGYNDGSFRPGQGVNRVEFLKMLFATTGVSVDPVVIEAPYDDINTLSWHAPYVQYAKEKNLFPVKGSAFHPNNPMDRSEVAEVIYRLLVMLKNDAELYTEDLVVPE